jgi:glycerol-3-phosphate dehydrogenase (NAD(P)+)
VLGAGGWGTALAVHLSRVGHRTRLWGRDAALVAEMQAHRTNVAYLPEVPFPDELEVSDDLARALGGAGLVVAAAPSHGTREIVRRASPHIASGTGVLIATKGLEQGSLHRVSQIVDEELDGRARLAVLSGPSFALELARQLPTAVSVASTDPEFVACLQRELRAPYFRLYGTDDVVGVELGGALKNVIAIAAGLAEGLGLGHNALAGLMTRGLAEISRLACAAGARRETLAGLSGLGDLVLTCTGGPSRNRRLGIELARGRSLQQIVSGTRTVAEGARTTEAALALADRYGVELPIATQVGELLAGRTDARTALNDLMLRPQRAELG